MGLRCIVLINILIQYAYRYRSNTLKHAQTRPARASKSQCSESHTQEKCGNALYSRGRIEDSLYAPEDTDDGSTTLVARQFGMKTVHIAPVYIPEGCTGYNPE